MMNLAEASSEVTIAGGEIEAAYFAAQVPFGAEGCCLLCFDNCTISFAAKMRHKVRSTFSPGMGKINVGKYGMGKRFVSSLKR